MGIFKGKTIIERVDSKWYKLKSTLSYINETRKVTVKPGFLTDGASIPKIFWSIIGCPLNGKFIGSSIIHDSLYYSHALPRAEADALFREMLATNGVNVVSRNIMYYSLRLFGAQFYNNKSDETLEKTAALVVIKALKKVSKPVKKTKTKKD